MPFQQNTIKDFIGQGITLPLKLDKGRPPLESGYDLIRASIRMILSWRYNTRFMLAEFGSRLEELLEEPNDQVLKDLIQNFVIDAIGNWERRVVLTSISISDVSPTAINVKLQYRIINSNTEDSFIYPFYRQIIY